MLMFKNAGFQILGVELKSLIYRLLVTFFGFLRTGLSCTLLVDVSVDADLNIFLKALSDVFKLLMHFKFNLTANLFTNLVVKVFFRSRRRGFIFNSGG